MQKKSVIEIDLLTKLATWSDKILRYAIENTKEGTPMQRLKGNVDMILQPEFRGGMGNEKYYFKHYKGNVLLCFRDKDYHDTMENWKKSLMKIKDKDGKVVGPDLLKDVMLAYNRFERSSHRQTNDEVVLEVERLFRQHNVFQEDFYSQNYNKVTKVETISPK
jgi:hypothetical protein